MNRVVLDEVKKECRKISIEVQELERLYKDERVVRFLELLKKYEDLKEPLTDSIIKKAYQNIPESLYISKADSNKIMVYMGSYIKNNGSILTYERDPKTDYKVYADLETGQAYSVLKDSCTDFEDEYLTLYLPIKEYSIKEYYDKYFKLREWFKNQIIFRTQEEVVKELKRRYNRKLEDVFPSFKNIDRVANMSLEEFVSTYAEDGMFENLLLSREESMRVKLYRKQNN